MTAYCVVRVSDGVCVGMSPENFEEAILQAWNSRDLPPGVYSDFHSMLNVESGATARGYQLQRRALGEVCDK